MMEALWEFERLKLFQFVGDYPDWSSTRLAEAVGHSLSWVKKWRQRFLQAKTSVWNFSKATLVRRKHMLT